MAQVSYPGVYIQEVPSGVRTITSVSTSVGAFFGRASKGPIDKAVRLFSLADYEREFGEPHPKSDLARSVRQFFSNGGTNCYVVRLAKDADKATVTLTSLDASRPVLEVTAKAAGLWANNIRMEVDYDTPRPEDTFNIRVIQEDAGEVIATESFTTLSMDVNSPRYAPTFISQSSELVQVELASGLGDPSDGGADYNSATFDGFSSARRPFSNTYSTAESTFNTEFFGNDRTSFQISVNGRDYVTIDLASDGNFSEANHGALATEIERRINDQLTAELSPAEAISCTFSSNLTGVGRFLTITAATPGSGVTNKSVHVRRSPSNDIAAAMMMGVDQGGVELSRWSNFRPAPTASILPIGDPTVAGDISLLNGILSDRRQQEAHAESLTRITFDGSLDVDLTADYSLQTDPGATANTRWVKNAPGESSITGDHDGVREKLRIIADAINDEADLPYQAELWGYQLAVISTEGTVNNMPSIATTHTALGGEFITSVRQFKLGPGGAKFVTGGAAGTDGDAPALNEYLGSQNRQTGFHALDPVDLFNLMVLPEDEEVDEATMQNIWGPASNYCAQHRAFLIVDPPKSWTDSDGRPAVAKTTSKINDLRVSLVKDHAAVFYPRLQYSDGGPSKSIGPAGAIAGLMARTDASRGVWKAPAGIEAGVRGINGLTVELTDRENGVLNQKGVNCIRIFPNGIVNWGARTLDGDDSFGSEWKYIPIRRLALMIEESLYRGTRWAVFEPNDERLWSNIRLNVNAYMMGLFRQGAFQGTDPKAAFYVKCDADTTTQNDRNKGIVNVEVGFAPVKPAEFVVIKIQQIAGDL